MQRDLTAVVVRARRGDADATETLVRHALTLALRTSAATLGTREEAADVAQEVVIDVLRDLRKLRDPSRFDAWVHRVTARRALRHLQAKRSRFASDLSSLFRGAWLGQFRSTMRPALVRGALIEHVVHTR